MCVEFSQFFTIFHIFAQFSFLLLRCAAHRLIANSICTIGVDAKRILNWIIPFNWRPSRRSWKEAAGLSGWRRDREIDRQRRQRRQTDRQTDWRKLLWQLLVGSRDLESTSQLNSSRVESSRVSSAWFDSTNGVNGPDSGPSWSCSWSCKRKANANASAAFSCNYVADIKMKFSSSKGSFSLVHFLFLFLSFFCFLSIFILRALQLVFPTLLTLSRRRRCPALCVVFSCH